jgi:hypothetical protein
MDEVALREAIPEAIVAEVMHSYSDVFDSDRLVFRSCDAAGYRLRLRAAVWRTR